MRQVLAAGEWFWSQFQYLSNDQLESLRSRKITRPTAESAKLNVSLLLRDLLAALEAEPEKYLGKTASLDDLECILPFEYLSINALLV